MNINEVNINIIFLIKSKQSILINSNIVLVSFKELAIANKVRPANEDQTTTVMTNRTI